MQDTERLHRRPQISIPVIRCLISHLAKEGEKVKATRQKTDGGGERARDGASTSDEKGRREREREREKREGDKMAE